MIEYKEGCKWCEARKNTDEHIEAIARRVAREEIYNMLRILEHRNRLDDKVEKDLGIDNGFILF